MTISKKYLITGGCGFIGSCLVRNLLKKGEIVINIDKLTYASNKDSVGEENLDNYRLIDSDINTPNLISKILKETKPNYIIHLAAESHVDRSIDKPDDFINSNILGTYNMLKSSYEYWIQLEDTIKNQFRFIYVSTDEVYGSIDDLEKTFDEKSPIKPNSPYAASKASGDLLTRAWFKTYNLPTIITNSSNNYGIWQFPEKLIPLVLKKCLKNEKIPIYGNGEQIRDWINVEDNTEGILEVLKKGKIGSNYNIGSGNEISNIELVKLICTIIQKFEPKTSGFYHDLIDFVDDRPAHDFRYALNTKKINVEIGWKPKILFKDGLAETIRWYLNNKSWLFNEVEERYSGQRLGKIET